MQRMNPKHSDLFTLGKHRAVYFWAGPGTIRMNRLKFLNAPVDEHVHIAGHTSIGAIRLVKEARFNWIYLMYDWGFAPEIEQADWRSFADAVRVYHEQGARVFGYVQLSNCVRDGSFKNKDWYVLNPQGRAVHYYSGRYMTCWRSDEWHAHLREMVKGIVDVGADGVFFDNPWHGAQTSFFGGVWLGSPGCFCEKCRAAFRAAHHAEMPTRIDPGNGFSQTYLRWRANQVTQRITDLAAYARSLKNDIVVSVNDFDAVMRPSFVTSGIDLAALARVQDVVMIENYALPRDKPAGTLVNNAITLHTASALCGDTPVTTDPYDKGIGFDRVYAARRFQQGMAEAAAANCPMVVKGTEFNDARGAFTLLSAEAYVEQRNAIGNYHSWLEVNAELFRGRTNAATIGVLYPDDVLWQNWGVQAKWYFGIAQTLTFAGLAWRVVRGEDNWHGLKYLILTSPREDLRDQLESFQSSGGRVIVANELENWEAPPPSFLARHERARNVAEKVITELYRAYFDRKLVRALFDGTGLTHVFWQTTHFRLPSANAQHALVNRLGDLPTPYVVADKSVLIEVWRQANGKLQVHLMNYASEPTQVQVQFEDEVRVRILSPDSAEVPSAGNRIELMLDVYAVLVEE